GIPANIQKFFDTLQQYDGFIIASPEHNGLVPAVFKNTIDWLSRINMKFLGDKPLVLLSASPGGYGGANNLNVLKNLVPWWGGQLVADYSIGNYFEKIDPNTQTINNEEDIKNLKSAVGKLEEALKTVVSA
ncbi:NADPH-dependent FMN reductase, partial [Xanthovirga aplysinae]|uniref:NADPH-dependent FMN reductase n=1 Tax=Xanthovirga aplysinae TaxID=2529853 RepID=UPI0012BD5138